jgi:hypothetical protein
VAAAKTGRLDGRVVAVSGVAGAGPAGQLRSAVNGESCVWHRHIVDHRQVRFINTDRGQTQRSSRSKRVADEASRDAFALRGAAAGVWIYPQAMTVDRPEARTTRVLPGLATEGFPDDDALMSSTRQTYWHREWIIRSGVSLFVLGQVETQESAVSLRRPAQGPHVISTRSAATVRRRTAVAVLSALVLGPVAAVSGTVALVVHFA